MLHSWYGSTQSVSVCTEKVCEDQSFCLVDKILWIGGFIWVRTEAESDWVSSLWVWKPGGRGPSMLTGAGGGEWSSQSSFLELLRCPSPHSPGTAPLQRFCLTLDYLDPKAVTMSNFVNVDFLVNCGKEAAYLFWCNIGVSFLAFLFQLQPFDSSFH